MNQEVAHGAISSVVIWLDLILKLCDATMESSNIGCPHAMIFIPNNHCFLLLSYCR